jgi:hypothetical protein
VLDLHRWPYRRGKQVAPEWWLQESLQARVARTRKRFALMTAQSFGVRIVARHAGHRKSTNVSNGLTAAAAS